MSLLSGVRVLDLSLQLPGPFCTLMMADYGAEVIKVDARNPRLVYCSISGYGQTGPMRETAGHDINYISYAGILGQCGQKDGPPALPPVQIGDLRAKGVIRRR